MRIESSDTDLPSDDKGEESVKSPEYVAFETLVKQVMSVSKEEIDRREKADREARSKGSP